MPTNRTKNYDLSQWEPEDAVRRTDFNEDNEKIDAAIKAVDAKADGLAQSKADQSALDKLEQTVTSLSGTVQQHGSTMTTLGNCQIQKSTYRGTGGTTRTITLPENTLLAVIYGEDYTSVTAVLGVKEIICVGGMGYGGNIIATWADKSVKFEYKAGNFGAAQTVCNQNDVLYHVIALRTLS